MKIMRTTAFVGVVTLFGVAAQQVLAEDATVVAPDHYKVEFENDQVRVVRITYAPGEESPMHDHPNAVLVLLTDQNVQFTLPDGSQPPVEPARAGTVQWSPAQSHAAKNMGGQAEALLIELKQ